MAVKLQNHAFVPPRLRSGVVFRDFSFNSVDSLLYSSYSSPRWWRNSECVLSSWGNSRRRCLVRSLVYGYGPHPVVDRRRRRLGHLVPLVSAEDEVTVNGRPSASTSNGVVEERKAKVEQSFPGEDLGDRLVRSIHDAARVFELALGKRPGVSSLAWFSTAWLGIDRNAWVKTLSYQAAVYSLLQAATEIASRGDERDRDVNIFVQRSLLRQSAPLESLIKDKLPAKQPDTCQWFWSEQVPLVVASFITHLEDDSRFSAATAVLIKRVSLGSGSKSDISLLLLALACIAAITKLGPTKVFCPQFFSTISEETGRLMDMLVDFIPISQAYYSIKNIGLRREFLLHFGPRAASFRVTSDCGSDEIVFWVNLVQNQLQQAIKRERIWSKLTTSESIEVLEKDLAIFGFFIALGRSTKSFLSANGFDVIDYPIEGYIRYLIGGSVLYYPQLSSISSYQLFVEVVCEELDWLRFYPGSNTLDSQRQSHGHRKEQQSPPNAEAIPMLIDVCSHWIQSFIKYSKWLEDPSNIKAARFLSQGHSKLMECIEELRTSGVMLEISGAGSEVVLPNGMETDTVDKAWENVEGALNRLENLLQELHVSRSRSGNDQLEAACSDLEKIRRLKKEAEFLEASFRAKAASLRQGDEENSRQPSTSEQKFLFRGNWGKNGLVKIDFGKSILSGLLKLFMQSPTKAAGADLSPPDSSVPVVTGLESNEVRRFESLRNELMELEKRVQRSTNQDENGEEIVVVSKLPKNSDPGSVQLIKVQKQKDVIGKTLEKLKKTSVDVLQGTQLLAIDAATAMCFIQRALIGDELTEKERKTLQRTLTDLASVIPIGILMLLPVTAVGHAAMLAAIQRYVPSLIPSTYGAERLDLWRQLEKIREMETTETDDKVSEELS